MPGRGRNREAGLAQRAQEVLDLKGCEFGDVDAAAFEEAREFVEVVAVGKDSVLAQAGFDDEVVKEMTNGMGKVNHLTSLLLRERHLQ